MKYGYARVSTEDQNEGRQLAAMIADGIDPQNIFLDKLSGKNTERPGLKKMLDTVKAGDEVYIHSLDRLARSTEDLLRIVDELNRRGVNLRSKDGKVDTTTPDGKLFITVLAAVAEFERSIMLQRQREGIAIAKDEGRYKGNHGHKKPLPKDFEMNYFLISNNRKTKEQAAKDMGITRPTLNRMINDYETGAAK